MGNKFESLKEVNNFSEISNQYNALICDIWGVIHNGQELFPGINECLLNFKKFQLPEIIRQKSVKKIKNI